MAYAPSPAPLLGGANRPASGSLVSSPATSPNMNSSSSRPSVIDRALEGTISQTDFKSFVADFIRDQNTNTMRSFDIQVSKSSMDFGLGNSLHPVVSLDETKCCVDKVTLTSNHKKNLTFEIYWKRNHKFDLVIEGATLQTQEQDRKKSLRNLNAAERSQKDIIYTGELPKGKSVELTFKLRVFCTTRIYQVLRMGFSLGDKAKKKGPEDVGYLYFAFKIDSELSSSVDFDELEFGPQLAAGGYGTVFKGSWRAATVAIKRLNNFEDMVDELRESAYREIRLMSKMSHSHIVTYMGATQIPGQPLCLVMEFVDGGSLTKLLTKPLDDRFKVKLAMDVANGMAFLHANQIYHRDLKPDNLLVVSPHADTQVNLKITDFGTSRYSSKKASNRDENYMSFASLKQQAQEQPREALRLTKGVGTLIYQAPELLGGRQDYSIEKADLYSFGVTLWQIFTGKEPYSDPPYKEFTTFQIIDFVTSGKRLEIPKNIPEPVRQTIAACWQHDADRRPGFKDLQKSLADILKSLPVVAPAPAPAPSSYPSSPQISAGAPPTSYTDAAGPKPSPAELAQVGWMGEIERAEAENKLAYCPLGTFLLRWSQRSNSYVLSYVRATSGADKVQHIAYIKPTPGGGVTVDKQDGSVSTYPNLLSYIEAMRNSGIITSAVQIQEDFYDRTPQIYQKAPTIK